jgi:exodeoxyribonuclease VII large subunit
MRPMQIPPGDAPPRDAAPDRDIYSVSRLNREVGCCWSAVSAASGWRRKSRISPARLGTLVFLAQGRALRFAAPCSGSAICSRPSRRATGKRCWCGRIGLYEPRGEYQLLVDHMEDAGLGALKRQFEELTAKLAAEGLFAPNASGRCRGCRGASASSPRRPGRRSATSARARAALSGRRVLIYPVPVQGAQAAAEIVAALALGRPARRMRRA